MKRKNLVMLWTILLLLFGGNIMDSTAQDIKDSLFKEAKQALQDAKDAKADLLAPKNFGEGMKYYSEAEEDLENGKNLETIRKKLRAAVSYFDQATKATELAEITLRSSMNAKQAAKAAQAENYAKELWDKAEEKFNQAGREVEDGDIKNAKKKSLEAEDLYRRAELEAIKATYLSETWELLEQAEEMEVRERAPKTLLQAQMLARKAEKELSENRYDTDLPRSLAQQAKYEAQHAIYLSKTIDRLKEDDKTFEDLILSGEKPLEKIAATMDFVASFDNGLDETTNRIIATTKAYQDSIQKLGQDLEEGDRQINNLIARVDELKKQLGGMEKEKSDLAQRMETQARIRKGFVFVEELFSREEAQILRDQDNIIIRLVGLNFDVGRSIIRPKYFSLLTKLHKAIETFPECTVTIEGHTDSHGSDQRNMQLSQERAEAVKQYIVASMGFDESRISSEGYGENNPIANNETEEGRAKNRRIDAIIHLQLVTEQDDIIGLNNQK